MKQHIENLLKNAVLALAKDHEIPENVINNIKVERAKDKAHGDFATNLALILAKPLKMNPRAVAELLIKNLEQSARIEKTEIAGPGFINFFVSDSFTAIKLQEMSSDARLGIKEAKVKDTVVVDYSAPNVAKEMAVHHIRSTVIGDAVVRVLEFLGHKVIRANHVGDWGTQFGMLIAYLEEQENKYGTNLDCFSSFIRGKTAVRR